MKICLTVALAEKSLPVLSPSTRQSSSRQAHSKVLHRPRKASLVGPSPSPTQADGPRVPSLFCAMAWAILSPRAGLSLQPCLKSHSVSTYLIRPHSLSRFWGACHTSRLWFVHLPRDKASHLFFGRQWFTTSLWYRDHTPGRPHYSRTLPPTAPPPPGRELRQAGPVPIPLCLSTALLGPRPEPAVYLALKECLCKGRIHRIYLPCLGEPHRSAWWYNTSPLKWFLMFPLCSSPWQTGCEVRRNLVWKSVLSCKGWGDFGHTA